jgi:TolB-like protein
MSGNTLKTREKTHWTDDVPDASVVEFTENRIGNDTDSYHRRRGIFSFVTELRRRKVCRAATAYCIALWLTCQVVELISPALGLPDWTLELVIVLGLVGFPIALILSWLFEVTPNGLMLDNERGSRNAVAGSDMSRSRFDQVIDCSLLLVAVVIGAELALSSFASGAEASPVPTEEFYISAFPVVSEKNGEAFSNALRVELQHEMARLPKVKVMAPANLSNLIAGSSLTGSVSIGDGDIQVTAIVVSNASGELTWSEILSFPIKDSGATPRSIAKGIVAVLEGSSVVDLIPGGQDD